jgi:hypothetical protein
MNDTWSDIPGGWRIEETDGFVYKISCLRRRNDKDKA